MFRPWVFRGVFPLMIPAVRWLFAKGVKRLEGRRAALATLPAAAYAANKLARRARRRRLAERRIDLLLAR